MKNFWLTGVAGLLFLGYGKEKGGDIQVFDLDRNLNVDTSGTWKDFASSVEVIPLETNDSVLLAAYSIFAVDGEKIIGINRVVNKTSDGWFILSGAKADIRILNTKGNQVQK